VQHDKKPSSLQQRSNEAWDPSRFMRALLSWDPFFSGEMTPAPREMMTPAFEVKDTPEAFVFHADVPGVKDKDVQVQFQGNRLTVTGKRDLERADKQETYYTYERSYGSFARSFTLPDSADVDKASAEMKDGVLSITIPKRQSERPRNLEIKSGNQPKS
jgi:HSP20 family protein